MVTLSLMYYREQMPAVERTIIGLAQTMEAKH